MVGTLFNRQYLIARDVPAPYRSWSTHQLGEGWQVLVNSLPMAAASSERDRLMILGEALDPGRAAATNQEVAEELLDVSGRGSDEAWRRLESRLARLAGRWVVVASLGGRTRLYPDAFGTGSTVYATAAAGQQIVASSPQTIAELVGHPRMPYAARMRQRPGIGWPGTLLPWEEIRRLLPNFYFDLDTWSPSRFWPRQPTPQPPSVPVAAARMAEALVELARCAATRLSLRVGLTAGYDSRLTLAAMVAAGISDPGLFTQIRPEAPAYEVEVATEIARIAGVPHRVMEVSEKVDPALDALMRRNSGDFGSVDAAAAQFAEVVGANGTVVLSHLEQVFKRRFPLADDVESARQRYRRSDSKGYGEGRDLAMAEFDAWAETLPGELPTHHFDIWAWELAWGTWIPNKYVVIDTVAPVMAFQNCRDLQMIALGMSEQVRVPPHELLIETLRQLAPELAELPVNTPLHGHD